jgi:hypothetical protein
MICLGSFRQNHVSCKTCFRLLNPSAQEHNCCSPQWENTICVSAHHAKPADSQRLCGVALRENQGACCTVVAASIIGVVELRNTCACQVIFHTQAWSCATVRRSFHMQDAKCCGLTKHTFVANGAQHKSHTIPKAQSCVKSYNHKEHLCQTSRNNDARA